MAVVIVILVAWVRRWWETVASHIDRNRVRPVPAVDTMISAEVMPVASEEIKLARKLQDLGFRVLSLDGTMSVDGSQSLWTSVFGVQFEEQSRPGLAGLLDETEAYQKALRSTVIIPPNLKEMIQDIAFIEPPELY